MEHTEEQKAEFKRQFSVRRRNQLILAAPLVAMMIAFVATQDEATQTALGMPLAMAGPVLGVVLLGGVAFSFKNWRCPACNKYLGKGIGPKHCHACGVQLR